MDLTPANLRALRTTFNSQFRQGYDNAETFYQDVCTMVSSSTSQNDYGWMTQLPKMREWLGERVLHNLGVHSYTLKNKRWELSFAVNRDDILDDNLGIYSEIAAAHGEAARQHPDELVTDLIEAGTSSLCFDGQYFYDTDHPVSKHHSALGTYSNNLTSTALTQDNFMTAYTTMRKYKDDAGRLLGVRPNVLAVPPDLEFTARKIVAMPTILTAVAGTDTDASSPANVTQGVCRVVVLPRLTSSTAWYLLDTSRRIKPFVFQTREPVKFVSKTQDRDDNVVYQNEYHWLATARYNAGYTLPFLALRAVA